MTALYYVECQGGVREVYAIEAESEQDAMENWVGRGSLVIAEAQGVEAVSAKWMEDIDA